MASFIDITYNGETHSLPDWARILNITYDTLYSRYISGCSVEEMFERPVNYRETVITDEKTGETHTISEWAKITGVPINTIYYRYNVYKKSGHESVSPVKEKAKKYAYNGDEFTDKQWCNILGFRKGTITENICHGRTMESIIKPFGSKKLNVIYFVDEYGNPYNEEEWENKNRSL